MEPSESERSLGGYSKTSKVSKVSKYSKWTKTLGNKKSSRNVKFDISKNEQVTIHKSGE